MINKVELTGIVGRVEIRRSSRTHNGLLKIKVTNPACGFYKEDNR